ncbi:MAG: carbamoyltransferase HypF [Solirubrobacterales bacterium]|nr:carbamoyltransferase HypF [Solirubrobacterales bacterium]
MVVEGTVQGVGFRPFVHRLAARHGLGGYALNDGRGVLIEVEGEAGALDSFGLALAGEAPSPAAVERVGVEEVPPRGEHGFRIAPSLAGIDAATVPPDTATCETCLEELADPADRRFRYPFINCTACGPRFTIVRRPPYDRVNTTMAGFEMCAHCRGEYEDPGDRRFRYPFINCTACGPRFTIVRRPPYDRVNTTMAGFEMCADCRAEYEDPGDRRFHAEPIACPACGPRLSLGEATGEAALAETVRLLGEGAVVAVKGLGGYHLACDATDEQAVARLRRRKGREQKPFAVMSSQPASLVELDRDERRLLEGRQRPIVLACRLGAAGLADQVAPGTPWLGVMLPYTPLHHLLCADFGRPLVMTSGNRSDEPIATDDEEAGRRLDGIADAFLVHNRKIHRRCEDSVVRSGFPIRRSRGFTPVPLDLARSGSDPIVAAGAELKSTFCVLRGQKAFLSPHLGDLDSPLALAAFTADLELYLEMLAVSPAVVAHDLHPDYLSTRWALEQPAEAVAVQHHHAHAAACLAEHGERGPALALVFDGTGYGTDGTLWGGELLRCDLSGFERLAHLDPVPLPGGERAIRKPWRMAASYLERAGRPVRFERWGLVRESLKANAPLSSGAGRLFDAVAALLGVRTEVAYEGQAAIELESLAGDLEAEPYGCRVEGGVIHGADLVAAAHDDLAADRPRAEIAAAFHEGVAEAAATACAEAGEPRLVALTGGSFQNRRLLAGVSRRLDRHGFRVLRHHRVPPNDGGISYGQAAVAAARTDPCA